MSNVVQCQMKLGESKSMLCNELAVNELIMNVNS